MGSCDDHNAATSIDKHVNMLSAICLGDTPKEWPRTCARMPLTDDLNAAFDWAASHIRDNPGHVVMAQVMYRFILRAAPTD